MQGSTLFCSEYPSCNRTCNFDSKMCDKETAELRKLAHSIFDKEFKNKKERTMEYENLANFIGKEIHFGQLSKSELEEIIPKLKRCADLKTSPPGSLGSESAMSFVAAGTFVCTFDIPDESEMKMMFEPSNPYDPDAVLLLLNGQKIGYVPKTMNKSINPSTSQINDWKITVNRGQVSFII